MYKGVLCFVVYLILPDSAGCAGQGPVEELPLGQLSVVITNDSKTQQCKPTALFIMSMDPVGQKLGRAQ